MFDPILNRYRLRCATTDDTTWVSISEFRLVKRLRGAVAPAVFRVSFDCAACDGRHEALLTHDRLDYAPISVETSHTFTNLLTGTRELVGAELSDIVASNIRGGKWPWTFYCHPESAVRPGFPSSLRAISGDGASGDRLGVLVRCNTCARMSVNLVTRAHLDVPFHNDDAIGFVPEIVDRHGVTSEEAFRHQLESGRFASRWLHAS